MGFGFVKHFTVKIHFTCIDEATSSNTFLLNSLHLIFRLTYINYVYVLRNIAIYIVRYLKKKATCIKGNKKLSVQFCKHLKVTRH
jgi:hypothetical protein